MAALLSADAMAVRRHIFVYVFVTDLRLLVADTDLVQRFVQAEIRHNSSDHLIIQQFTALFHIKAVDVEDVVAGDNVPLFIHAQAAVRIAVVRKTHVQAVIDNEFLKVFDMSGAAVGIDIVPVRSVVDHVRLCAQSVKYTLRDRPGGAVGRVQTDLHVFESEL